MDSPSSSPAWWKLHRAPSKRFLCHWQIPVPVRGNPRSRQFTALRPITYWRPMVEMVPLKYALLPARWQRLPAIAGESLPSGGRPMSRSVCWIRCSESKTQEGGLLELCGKTLTEGVVKNGVASFVGEAPREQRCPFESKRERGACCKSSQQKQGQRQGMQLPPSFSSRCYARKEVLRVWRLVLTRGLK